jgi:DNA-binding CsgD family transcriptional regulator
MIAYELGLSVGTVGTLLSRAARKLGVRSRAMLVIEWNKRAVAEPE